MTKWAKLRAKILSGKSDANIPFDQLCGLLRRLGFDERIKGDHHTFTREDIPEIAELQPVKGEATAKNYQVKQVRQLIKKYDLP